MLTLLVLRSTAAGYCSAPSSSQNFWYRLLQSTEKSLETPSTVHLRIIRESLRISNSQRPLACPGFICRGRKQSQRGNRSRRRGDERETTLLHIGFGCFRAVARCAPGALPTGTATAGRAVHAERWPSLPKLALQINRSLPAPTRPGSSLALLLDTSRHASHAQAFHSAATQKETAVIGSCH